MCLRNLVILSFMLVVFSGCNSEEKAMDDLKNQTQITSRSALEEENSNTSRKAQAMERDLASRHRFFRAIQGRYEGNFQTEQGLFKIRINLTPSLEPYTGYDYREYRQIEEVVADLNGLHFNVNILQWNPSNPISAVGCTIEGIKPNLKTGVIKITSEGCKNIYNITIARNSESYGKDLDESSYLAKDLIEGALNNIEFLVGEIQPSTNPNIFNFKAKKVSGN